MLEVAKHTRVLKTYSIKASLHLMVSRQQGPEVGVRAGGESGAHGLQLLEAVARVAGDCLWPRLLAERRKGLAQHSRGHQRGRVAGEVQVQDGQLQQEAAPAHPAQDLPLSSFMAATALPSLSKLHVSRTDRPSTRLALISTNLCGTVTFDVDGRSPTAHTVKGVSHEGSTGEGETWGHMLASTRLWRTWRACRGASPAAPPGRQAGSGTGSCAGRAWRWVLPSAGPG